ncbi:43kDa postsynaptic protein [Trema orientale]|uniref:RING-type E3 ubiquitin transferase n=1 Tax=Trema orientale TaxID=63057 RepID=A0A2P5FJU8_TREOI|nr:43kDa postsynaptic protein [Trema orientale]
MDASTDTSSDFIIHIPDQNDYYFFFRLINHCENQLTIEITRLISRREYFAQAPFVIRNMLNSIGIVEPSLAEYYELEIRFFASTLAQNPEYSHSRVLELTFNVTTHRTLYQLGQFEPIMSESEELFRTTSVPATKSSIEALEKVKVDDHESLSSTLVEQCCICLEKLSLLDNSNEDGHPHDHEVVQMPCSHLYHKHCIVRWLECSHMCPLCRYTMPT